MNVGVPKEKRAYEFRVGLPPAGVDLFVKYGHTVYIESHAGEGAGFTDEDYSLAGATILYSSEELYHRSDLLLRFTQPLAEEVELLRPGQALLGFLHLSALHRPLLDQLEEKAITAISYELVEEAGGYRPILAPLSELGGRMTLQIAASLLQNNNGGRGILLGGVAGVPPAEVVILGAGVAGSTAAAAFSSVGAHVNVLDRDLRKLQRLQTGIPASLNTLRSTPENIRRTSAFADVLIGAVLIPGAPAPVILTRDMIAGMRTHSVFIDLSIDQGGCSETSRPTTHQDPTYIQEGVIHYCVPTMSGVLGRTATHALFNGAYPYLQAIAKFGFADALRANQALLHGLTLHKGIRQDHSSISSGGHTA